VRDLTCLEICAGAGGQALGLEQAGACHARRSRSHAHSAARSGAHFAAALPLTRPGAVIHDPAGR
jgi:site-specific DNA-cytosine methylase